MRTREIAMSVLCPQEREGRKKKISTSSHSILSVCFGFFSLIVVFLAEKPANFSK
jgi:hypothetical protein